MTEYTPPASTPPEDAPPGKKASWKDRLKQVAEQGKQVAEQGKAKLAEQSEKRAQQWAEDPSTLWYGESQDATTKATGMAKARYRITKDRVWIDSGLLGTRTESVPLWSVKDMDVRQAVWQRGKDIGDVVLTLEDPAYAGGPSGRLSMTGITEPGATTSGQVTLDNISGPYAVVDILSPLVSEARTKKTIERQSSYVHQMTPQAFATPPQAAAPAAPVDVAEQLTKLAALRDQGILTEEEFAAQKSKLLGA